ncbi:beta-1,4-galactosyltransferase 5 [Oncorhynchus keta]|uniref:beta-1,4-galactosyltransferase 5 n=1 Tax=Oncorhynchus keta TaxID=8018 RepID=UPI0015FC63F4|nr:beta-1,4-galactosyltransferase 5 [Oncorhynchus keta]XP_052337821.1 beta-1,4-galactosyltransferase 5 [Oncorhynchus keta]XP_052337822.1 beta-1,4-galactosyltransferase 5 [Oncorhynchus keta]XP_052337823.1 beta-1,4-galactosyltransferase 5 [Oncorhynchus keta]XP_052337824.1 beta-1,4-galactosyltransferase 5 [Oncorhynchus keta]XP_052337825.1 beta-1,4-galactosyltransferase 5 [Oncorhynchus keta]XP_052337826.1 beta-1,4-galactosyltransferase 5 [Oncorhynchus keta]XP_052337828.1 beta-1,4-galactosyltrans
MPTHLRFRRRSFLGLIFLFSLSTTALYFIYSAPGIVNEYLFMVQATGIHIKDNVKNIGVQVLEQVVRGGYNINGTDYTYDFNLSESDVPPTTYLPDSFTYLSSQICPERLPSMKGRLEVNMSEMALEDVERVLLNAEPSMTLGGYWKPRDCVPRWKVAILVPFRNRHEHLPILLRHLIPALQRQRLQFAFYVVEQVGSEPFNRAMLFNVGFREAMRDLDWDCMVFHDVDHMLENDRNYYGCGDMPRHFAVKLNKYSYMLPYNEFFGGVSGLTVEQFTKINGFPNAFWGWGGEDDDLWNRVQYANYTVSRPQGELGRYMSIPHHHRGEVQFLGRYTLLRRSKERQSLDGLNNLRYSPLLSRRPLYTNISVSLSRKLAPIADYN